jgi:hypothetical protein
VAARALPRSRQFDALLADFYDAQLRAVDEEAEGLTGKQAQRSSEATLFASMAKRASKLITRIQIAAADGPSVAPAVA